MPRSRKRKGARSGLHAAAMSRFFLKWPNSVPKGAQIVSGRLPDGRRFAVTDWSAHMRAFRERPRTGNREAARRRRQLGLVGLA